MTQEISIPKIEEKENTASSEKADGEGEEGSYDISTCLHYTRVSSSFSSSSSSPSTSNTAVNDNGNDNGNEAAGPMRWGHTAFEADSEELVPVTVRDIRGRESQFTLDGNGFQVVRHRTSLTRDRFFERPLVKRKYYAETEELLKRVTGASLVRITHHVVRRSHVDDADSLHLTRPITQVHVDSNDARIRQTVRAIYGSTGTAGSSSSSSSSGDLLLSRRYAMINVWRPLRRCSTGSRDPLAFCDGATVPDACYVPRQIVMPGNAAPQVNTGVTRTGTGTGTGDTGDACSHAWYYLRDMDIDEVLLLKCWDSLDGVVRRCPHSSVPSNGGGKGEDRESIELRCLLFWQD